MAASLLNGQDIFIFANILSAIYALGGPRRRGRPRNEIGIVTWATPYAADVVGLFALVPVYRAIQARPAAQADARHGGPYRASCLSELRRPA
jgi:hypothetical protein